MTTAGTEYADLADGWQDIVGRWARSPFLFVIEALFHMRETDWQPWVPGTERPPKSPRGPELWQGNFLKDVGVAKVEGKRRFTVRAGHGVGKSTVEAWLVLWFLLFHRQVKVPVTANSQDQLRDVVWAEIALWHRLLPEFLRNLVEVSTERVFVKADPTGSFAVARTARPEKPEALQGFHASVLAFFIEEASGIEDIIFETAGGALSSEDSWVFMFANPTRAEGYFYRSHTEARDRWRTYHVPCSASSRVSPNYARDMAAEYGADSNIYRVRVEGEFAEGDDGLISLAICQAAVGREVGPTPVACVWGLDVARFGDDATALAKRRGNVLIEKVKEWRKLDTMQVAGLVMREWAETPVGERPAAINVDVIGLGAGVLDRLRELGVPAIGVNVAEAPSTAPERFMRLRDELWWGLRDWLWSRAVSMPRDDALVAEMVGPTYRTESSGKIKVESKDDLKKRGRKSPNKADALCLTFAGGEHVRAVARLVAWGSYDPFSVGTPEFEQQIGETRVQDYDPMLVR